MIETLSSPLAIALLSSWAIIAGLAYALWRYEKSIARHMKALAEARNGLAWWGSRGSQWLDALHDIEAATRAGKSGAARKINRMAKEGLK